VLAISFPIGFDDPLPGQAAIMSKQRGNYSWSASSGRVDRTPGAVFPA
jgi:hypothetical protein